jgi:hypothetical protein
VFIKTPSFSTITEKEKLYLSPRRTKEKISPFSSTRITSKTLLGVCKLPSEAFRPHRPPFDPATFPFTIAARSSKVRRHHPSSSLAAIPPSS